MEAPFVARTLLVTVTEIFSPSENSLEGVNIALFAGPTEKVPAMLPETDPEIKIPLFKLEAFTFWLNVIVIVPSGLLVVE